MTVRPMTTFNYRAKPVANFLDRTGQKLNDITLTEPGFQGAWWGRCGTCGSTKLYTKERIKKGHAACRCKK